MQNVLFMTAADRKSATFDKICGTIYSIMQKERAKLCKMNYYKN